MLQNLIAALFRQVHIEQYQVRAGYCIALVNFVKKLCRGVSVIYDPERGTNMGVLDRFLNHKDVCLVVFNEQDVAIVRGRVSLEA